MKPMTKAVAVALLHILLISSLGAKLLYDRRTCPQAWFKTQRYDPDLPIRGRYLSMRLDVKDSRTPDEVAAKFANEIAGQDKQKTLPGQPRIFSFGRECGSIQVRNGVAMAVFERETEYRCDNLSFMRQRRDGVINDGVRLENVVLFFIPDTAEDPSRVKAGDELWVLATIPRKGPPRPIQLGVKKAGENEIRQLRVQ